MSEPYNQHQAWTQEAQRDETRRRRLNLLMLFLLANSVACQWYCVYCIMTQGAK